MYSAAACVLLAALGCQSATNRAPEAVGDHQRAITSHEHEVNGFNNGFNNGFTSSAPPGDWGYYNGLFRGFNNGFNNGFFDGILNGYYDQLQNGFGNGSTASGMITRGLFSQTRNLSWMKSPHVHTDGNVLRNDAGDLVVDWTFLQDILQLIAAYGTGNPAWAWVWDWDYWVVWANPNRLWAQVGHWEQTLGGHPIWGWAYNPWTGEPPGWLSYGPYENETGPGYHVAYYDLLVHDNSYGLPVVYIDVHDASTNEVLNWRVLYAWDFAAPWTYQNFTLPFWLDESHGNRHALEFRQYVYGYGYIATQWTGLAHTRDASRDPVFTNNTVYNIGHADGSAVARNYLQYATKCALAEWQQWSFQGVTYRGAIGLAQGAPWGQWTIHQLEQMAGCMVVHENEAHMHRTFNLTSPDIPQAGPAFAVSDPHYLIDEGATWVNFDQFGYRNGISNDSWPFGRAVFCGSFDALTSIESGSGRVCETDRNYTSVCMAKRLGFCENVSGGLDASGFCQAGGQIDNNPSDYYRLCHDEYGTPAPWVISTQFPNNAGTAWDPCNVDSDCHAHSCNQSTLSCNPGQWGAPCYISSDCASYNCVGAWAATGTCH
jgi:hypothetical protein